MEMAAVSPSTPSAGMASRCEERRTDAGVMSGSEDGRQVGGRVPHRKRVRLFFWRRGGGDTGFFF